MQNSRVSDMLTCWNLLWRNIRL